jgi:hypothetical protein
LPGGVLLYTLNGNISADQELESNPLWIYPVPVKLQIHWEIQSVAEVEIIEVMDVTGKIIYTDYPKQNQGEIQCANFTPGVYFIQVKSGDRIFQRKFQKE